VRYGMVIDLKRCIGCHACQIACNAENGTRPGTLWARVHKQELGTFPSVRRFSLPLLCMHCRLASCVEVCPTGASQKRADGIVTVDSDKCVGCRYCLMVCPYGSRYYQGEEWTYFPGNGINPYEAMAYAKHPTGVVEKCDFCLSRVERGLQPACVAACPTKARTFGDLHERESEVSRLIDERGAFRLREEVGTCPSVFYLPPWG
jgi:Fe-S-cluster-containing dehydrogenase component